MNKIVYVLIGLQTFCWTSGLMAQEVDSPQRDQAFWQSMVMIGIAILCFYFIVWRPNQKQRKQMDEQRSALKKGDRVVAMGILGTVLRVQEQTIIVKMYDGAKIEFLKGAITEVIPGTEEDAKKAEKEDRP